MPKPASPELSDETKKEIYDRTFADSMSRFEAQEVARQEENRRRQAIADAKAEKKLRQSQSKGHRVATRLGKGALVTAIAAGIVTPIAIAIHDEVEKDQLKSTEISTAKYEGYQNTIQQKFNDMLDDIKRAETSSQVTEVNHFNDSIFAITYGLDGQESRGISFEYSNNEDGAGSELEVFYEAQGSNHGMTVTLDNDMLVDIERDSEGNVTYDGLREFVNDSNTELTSVESRYFVTASGRALDFGDRNGDNVAITNFQKQGNHVNVTNIPGEYSWYYGWGESDPFEITTENIADAQIEVFVKAP